MTDWMTVWVRTDVLLHDTCMSFRESGVITSRVGDCRWKRQYVRLVMSLPRTCMFGVLGQVSSVSCPWRLASMYPVLLDNPDATYEVLDQPPWESYVLHKQGAYIK